MGSTAFGFWQTTMASTQKVFSHLPPPIEFLAILIGCAELSIFGVRGLSNPGGWLEGFGLPVLRQPKLDSSTPQGEQEHVPDVHHSQRALVDALAARNIQNGVLILTFACFIRDRRALGTVVLAGLITTGADTLVAWRYGVKNSVAGHLIGIANCIGIGGGLLLWGREEAIP